MTGQTSTERQPTTIVNPERHYNSQANRKEVSDASKMQRMRQARRIHVPAYQTVPRTRGNNCCDEKRRPDRCGGKAMSAITSKGRRGNTVVPNFRWEDPDLDPYQLRIAGWLASHADQYLAKHVTRNEIARCTGISAGKVSSSLDKLQQLGIVEISTVEIPQSQGGHRLHIVFDFDAWETEARSCGDRDPGHVVTTPGHVVTSTIGHQLEEQDSSSPLSAIESETRKQQATRVVTAWWDWKKQTTGKSPIANFPGTVKIVHKVLESGYDEADVKRALATLDAVSYASISRALSGATPYQSRNEKTMSVLERMAQGQIGVSA